jgi:hypothetical protein
MSCTVPGEVVLGDPDVLFKQVHQLGAQLTGDYVRVPIALEYIEAVPMELVLWCRVDALVNRREGIYHGPDMRPMPVVENEYELVVVRPLRLQRMHERHQQELGAAPGGHEHDVARPTALIMARASQSTRRERAGRRAHPRLATRNVLEDHLSVLLHRRVAVRHCSVVVIVVPALLLDPLKHLD